MNYCHEKFEGKNGAEMFDKLEEIICEFMESNEGAKIFFQHYNKDQNSALILAIVTPLMQRVYSMIIDILIFRKTLSKM